MTCSISAVHVRKSAPAPAGCKRLRTFPSILDLASHVGHDSAKTRSHAFKNPGSYAIEVAVAENFSYTGRNRILECVPHIDRAKRVSNSSNNRNRPVSFCSARNIHPVKGLFRLTKVVVAVMVVIGMHLHLHVQRDVRDVVDYRFRSLTLPVDRFSSLAAVFVSVRKKETEYLRTSIAVPTHACRLRDKIGGGSKVISGCCGSHFVKGAISASSDKNHVFRTESQRAPSCLASSFS